MTVRLLLVAVDGDLDPSLFATADDIAVVDAVPPESAGAAVATDDVDCVVTDGALEAALAVPVVRFAATPPADPASVDGFVRADGPDAAGRLADELRVRVADDPAVGPRSDGGTSREGVRHETILETMRDGALVVAPDGTVEYVNGAAEAGLGLDRDVFVGEHLSRFVEESLIAADDIERFERTVQTVVDGEDDSVPFQMTVTDVDGNPSTVEARIVSLPEDAPEGVLATVRDVTDRHAIEQELRTRRETIERLHEAATDLVAAGDETELCETAVEAAEDILDFDVCTVALRDGDYLIPKATASHMPEGGTRPFRIDEGLAGKTFQTGETIVLDDTAESERAAPADDSYRSGISVPIGDHGVFQAVAAETNAFDHTDRELAELLLSYVDEALQRLRIEDRLRERTDTIERLHESTADLVSAPDESALFDLTIDAAKRVLDLEACVLMVVDDDDLVISAVSGGDHTPPVGGVVDLEESLAGRTFTSGEPSLVEDVRERPEANPYDDAYRSALSVPIGDVGVFQSISTDVRRYDETDLRLAELLAQHVAEAYSRIRVEERLREREGALKEERDRFAALFENVPDAVAAFSFEDGRPIVRDVNGPFEEVFGWSADTIVGEDIDDYIVPPDREDRASSLNEKLLAGESLQTTGQRRTADGVRDFLLHVVPLEVGERSLEGYAIYTDITEQKRRERELERQNDRLDEFASIVSHDLRNPLNVAEGNLQMARETGEERFLGEVKAAHDRMARMIEELLTLARHGEVVGEVEPVDLEQVALESWGTVSTRDATLTVGDDGTFEADRERLSELLENLYRNAVEHAGEDVTVTVDRLADDAGFFVADDGPGIDEGDADAVFESGYTTAENGTGFGLTIVEQIAEAHDWAVSVGNDPETGGARFEFRFEE